MFRTSSIALVGLFIASCASAPKRVDLKDIEPSVKYRDRVPAKLEVVIAPEIRELQVSSDKAVLDKMYANKIKRCDVLYRKGHFTFATASDEESEFVEPTRTSTPVAFEATNDRFIADAVIESTESKGPVRKEMPVSDAMVDAILSGLRAAADSAELAETQDETATRPSDGYDYLVVVTSNPEKSDKTLLCGQVERRNQAGIKKTRTTGGGGGMMFLPGFNMYKGTSTGIRTTRVPGQIITLPGGGPKTTKSWITPLNVSVTTHFEIGLEVRVFDSSGNEVLRLSPSGVGRHRKGFGDYKTAIDRALVIAIRKALEQVSTETAEGLHDWASSS